MVGDDLMLGVDIQVAEPPPEARVVAGGCLPVLGHEDCPVVAGEDLGACPRCGHQPGMGGRVVLRSWAEGGWNVSCPDCHVERTVSRCISKQDALMQWAGMQSLRVRRTTR